MDSKEEANADGHRPNTATENSEGDCATIALQKRRARRVSFAEMTSVHFFDRDEEGSETPLSKNANKDDEATLGFGGQSEQRKESEGEDDTGNGDEDDDVMQMRGSFLRPIGSPSPGGSSRGSASSYDEEDNFFGPVAANFIRPGRLSDSAASDDNHDVTMDSTAFSMHFQSLARSESGVDSRTPTGVRLYVEEKTPNDTNIGSSMILTSGKKPVLKFSVPVDEVSGIRDSNDMSLLVDNPKKYVYDELPPELYELLDEGRKCELSIYDDNNNIDSASTGKMEDEAVRSADEGNNPVNVSNCSRKETAVFNSNHLRNGEVLAIGNEFDKPNCPPATPPNRHCPGISSSAVGAAASVTAKAKPYESPYQSNIIGCAEMPLVVAESSSVKQLQSLLISSSPSKLLELTSPLIEQPVSFLRNDYSECYEGQSSIQKSISKLELLEKCAFSSAFNKTTDLPIIKSLDFLKSPNLSSIMKENRHVSAIHFLEDSFTKEKFPTTRQSIISSKDHNRGENLGYVSKENNLEETLGHKMNGKSPHDLSAGKLSTDQSKYRGPSSSPSRINLSNNLKRSLFPSKQSGEDTVITETEALLAKIGPAGEKVNVVPPNFFLSPGRMFQKKISASPALHSSEGKELLIGNQLNRNPDRGRSEDSYAERILITDNPSAAATGTYAVVIGMRDELCSPSIEVSHVKDLVEVKETGNKEVENYNEKADFGTTRNFVSPPKENKSQFMHSKSLLICNQSSRDTSSSEDPAGKEFHVVIHDSVSSTAYADISIPGLPNVVEFPAASPPRKQLGYKDSNVTSTKSINPSGGLEKFSGKKRNIELDDQQRIEMSMMQRSPKFQKTGNSDPNGYRKTLSELADVSSKFSEDVEQLISKLIRGFGNKMIDTLEDMLVCRQKSQLYEILRAGIMPQSASVHDLQFQRIAEARQLLQKNLFERARLQLKHVKRDGLLKRLQLLGSKIQESQLLRAKLSSQQLKTLASVQVRAVGDPSFPSHLMKRHEVSHEKLDELRQNIESLEEKILNLEKTLSERSCRDTLASINEYLMERAHRRFIRMDMQMWVVCGVSSTSGQHIVVLKYLNFLVQSIKVTVASSLSQTTSYELNKSSIIKTFPNMDACTVFAFVFNAGTTHKYVGASTLVRETQVTSSVLGTLLDVLAEVQLAQLECRNLIQTKFCSQSVGLLDLMLCFINFQTGRKVFLTLDMSCLKRGTYPSETSPLDLGSWDDKQKYPLHGPTAGEIRDAVKSVNSGYMRILRLCRRLSELVQSAFSSA